MVPKGYVTFPQEGAGEPDPQPQKLSFRDVTSPINPQDYTLDSSGGKGKFCAMIVSFSQNTVPSPYNTHLYNMDLDIT